ncbi:MAG: hypothetical protein EPO47_11665 [Rugosibacter sp.]|nr:MAG: hypothetical protein EPO60_06250 [Rugosibacter sp.]TBR07172.1 MAG: hypothetical protein EPO47_11665 [Rugosibacter sp.]
MLKNLLGLLTGAILLLLGFMFSVLILSVIAVIGLGVWIYFWWKTRALRRAMQANMPRQEPDGQIIDGEAIVVEEYRVDMKKVLPDEPPQQ